MTLDEALRERWEEDGFLVMEGFVSPESCDRLIERANWMVSCFDPAANSVEGISVFSTKNQAHTTDAYFLGSADQIRFFLEEEAVDPDGVLTRPVDRAVNKIGHAQHDLDPVFDAFSRTPSLAALAADLGFVEPRLVQSMYIFKQPEIGGEVVCHQDSTFLYTEPETVVGFWFALEDATVDNGCLWALPGGHRLGLKKRFVRGGGGGLGVRFNVLDDSAWPSEGLVPLEAAKGTLVVLHGRLPHQSGANRSTRSRHAYSVHVVDAIAEYPDDNWLQRPSLPVRGF